MSFEFTLQKNRFTNGFEIQDGEIRAFPHFWQMPMNEIKKLS